MTGGYPHGLPDGFPEPPDLGTGAASDVSHCAAHLRYGWLGLGPRCGQRWWKCWKSPRNGRKPIEFIGKWWSPLTIRIPINSGICLIYWQERWNSSKGSGVEVAKTVRSDWSNKTRRFSSTNMEDSINVGISQTWTAGQPHRKKSPQFGIVNIAFWWLFQQDTSNYIGPSTSWVFNGELPHYITLYPYISLISQYIPMMFVIYIYIHIPPEMSKFQVRSYRVESASRGCVWNHHPNVPISVTESASKTILNGRDGRDEGFFRVYLGFSRVF